MSKIEPIGADSAVVLKSKTVKTQKPSGGTVEEAAKRADDKYYDPMSANMPMVEPGMTRREKEMFFATTFIMDRLADLRIDEIYELNKWVLFAATVICSIIGAFLIMCGLSYSIFFKSVKSSWVTVGFGAAFLIPAVLWFKYMVLPGKKEAEQRKKIFKTRDLLADKGVDDALVAQSKEFSKPPVQRIPCYFFLRKKRYKVIASTMREFSELVEKECGIPMSQQMMKYDGEYIDIKLDYRLVEDYGFKAGFNVIVYNRGGYETYLKQLELKTDKSHSVHSKIEVKVPEYHEPNAVELLGTSISQDVIDELHREVEACSNYEEAAPIGKYKIKKGPQLTMTPSQLNNKHTSAHKIEKHKSDKLYRIVDPRILAKMEADSKNSDLSSADDVKEVSYGTGNEGSVRSKAQEMQSYLQKEKNKRDDDSDEDSLAHLDV